MAAAHLSSEAQTLLKAFRAYRWLGDLPVRVTKSAFQETAKYLDAFIAEYGDVELKTKGAFV